MAVLPQAEFHQRLRLVDEAQTLSMADKHMLKAELHTRCHAATLDVSGRLLVPRDCRDGAGLQTDAEVAMLGRGGHFEIWNPGNRSAAEDQERERLKDISGELGIL